MEYATSWIDKNVREGHWTGETFGQFLRVHATSRPNDTALGQGEVSISWSNYLSEVERVAGGLSRLGVGVGDRVSVQLHNCVELAISVLAIWDIGAVYQPLNPMYRAAECESLIAAVDPKAVICSNSSMEFDHANLLDEVTDRLSCSPLKVIVGTTRPGWTNFYDLDGPANNIAQDPLRTALLGTTSGTTGKPKIYIHIQATQIFEAKALCQGLTFGSNDVMLAAAPMTHRGALMVGLMTSLVSGSRLVMGEARNTREIASIIENQKVTTFMGIPTIVSDLLHLHDREEWDATSLRVVLASGAPVTAELINRFHEQWPNTLAATGYGLSETGWCTFLRIADPPEKVYSSGRLAPATEIEIRDQSGLPLPLGETGEVHIRGPMNCAGYLKNDEATNQAIDADGWFASGDLAFMDKDGYLNPVGRSKHTIIRGGLNIYAEEIEHMLQEHPAVREVAIVPYPDPRLGERACAYVSLHAEASFDLDELVRFFSELDTARYTWPERVEVVDELPRNPIGKIDRIAISNLLQNLPG